jgi:hypothetical protein
MMFGDDIRNHRIQAEKDAEGWGPSEETYPLYLQARQSLALWVIAEQLFEVRSLFGIIVEHTNQPAADGYVEGEDNDCQPPKGD